MGIERVKSPRDIETEYFSERSALERPQKNKQTLSLSMTICELYKARKMSVPLMVDSSQNNKKVAYDKCRW